MIKEKYRLMLPTYWYENEVAEYHFEGVGGETDLQITNVSELGKQLILKTATYSLDVWEWVFFGRTQIGSHDKRRMLVRNKYRTKARFTLPTLRSLGREYGDLKDVTEDFLNKVIMFEFINSKHIDLPQLKEQFNYLRPVHVVKNQATVMNPTNSIGMNPSVRSFGIDYPRTNTFIAMDEKQKGRIFKEPMSVKGNIRIHDVPYPICGTFSCTPEEV